MSERGTGISWPDALLVIACVIALAVVLHGMVEQIRDLQRRVGQLEEIVKR